MPLSNYTGVYSNSFFGNINITKNNNTLICFYGNNSNPYKLNHWDGNVFEEPNGNNALNFTNISKGKANKLSVTFTDYSVNPPTSTTTFKRKNYT